jgi:hypothetical protein
VRLDAATEQLRQALQALLELERVEPAGVRRVYDMARAHLRSRYPEDGQSLGTLPPPTEPIRDPRAPA